MSEIMNFLDHSFISWIAAKVAILPGGLYWLFTEKFVGEYAKQTVELMFLRNKTELEETIRGGSAEALEKVKSKLALDVQGQIQPLIAQLNVITNKKDVIFNLEKEP